MSSTDIPSVTEDSEMLESDGEKVVTMMDVLQEQQDFEDDANAVLGASDEKNCTYPKGYIKRQAIFACLTCCADAKTDPTKRAGVCLACSLSCHENHELIELYTKRNFCCDCGNPKFNSNPCQFLPQKPDMNVNNNYNQNFAGLYCTCHRPYPDPESTFEDEMIQCIVCEDWLHASHLEATVPPNEQYSEMICKACMQKNEFLYDYSEIAVNIDVEVDVVSVNGTDPSSCNGTVCNGDADKKIEEEREKNDLDVEMAEKSEKSADQSVEDEKDISEKPTETPEEEISVKPADDKDADKDIVTGEENRETVTDINEASNGNPSDDSESVPKLDSVISQNTTEAPISTEQAEQNKIPDDPAESTKDNELEESNGKENDSEPSTQTADIASESNINNTDSISENKDLKVDNLTDVSADEKSETVTEQNSNEETKIAEQSNEIDLEDKDNAEVKNSDNFESTQLTEPTEETEHNESKDDVLESIDKIINDDTSTDETKLDEQVTENKESDSKEPVNDDKSISNDIEMEKNAVDNVKVGNKETDTEANEKEIEHNNKEGAKPVSEEKGSENKRKFDEDVDEDSTVKKPKLEDTKSCNRPRDVKKKLKGATFWPSNFRQTLCTCNECLTMYKDLSVLFLIDHEDTVTAYEALGKEMTEAFGSSQYEKGLQALSSLDRIQQINALTEYNKMRDKLLEFLKSFKDRQEIVKEEDIKAFFAGMKPKREPDGVYFCR